VTGSAGFVGRHIMRELRARGWTVHGCDLRASWIPWRFDANELFRIGQFPAHPVLSDEGGVYDLVVHCAYHVGGRAAIDGEPSYLALNLQLDSAMFDWVVRTGQRRVLYFSSSAVYPESLQRSIPVTIEESHQFANGGRALSENDVDLDDVRQPDARYGWAKLTGEQLARAAAAAGLPVHVVRPFSGYGGDQDLRYPFPAIVQRVRNRADLTVWGPPGQIRDWIHIDDVVRGALAVVDADYREPVNLCSGEPVEFGDLARQIYAATGRGQGQRPDLYQVQYREDRPTGVLYRVGDPTRMRTIYEPRVSLAEGITRALEEVPR